MDSLFGIVYHSKFTMVKMTITQYYQVWRDISPYLVTLDSFQALASPNPRKSIQSQQISVTTSYLLNLNKYQTSFSQACLGDGIFCESQKSHLKSEMRGKRQDCHYILTKYYRGASVRSVE